MLCLAAPFWSPPALLPVLLLLPTLCVPQVEMMIQRLGELAAFDIHNCSGRFMLNLSRSLDRFMAMRLQVRCGGQEEQGQ